jgi:hypothetical protein
LYRQKEKYAIHSEPAKTHRTFMHVLLQQWLAEYGRMDGVAQEGYGRVLPGDMTSRIRELRALLTGAALTQE